ncbi:TetR/AcrR family transcriptional regulator [Nocardia alni]|uniref:TetR/AcrR family transcriptional regulator n=1 Tax=Nocardia alni TaxID=2815723 RepID=UPI001C247714|nr:TetR family transcriptional regulator [Nocardia alni]
MRNDQGAPPAHVQPVPSARRIELLAACYGYALDHGLAGVSLRTLAAAVGSSPRVLLYLFGSKDQLIREVLAHARHRDITQMTAVLETVDPVGEDTYGAAAQRIWEWLSAPEQRAMTRLNYEAFLRSVGHDPGPWAGFATESINDWKDLLLRHLPGVPIDVAQARATRSLALIRGLLLELLADADPVRVTAATQQGW